MKPYIIKTHFRFEACREEEWGSAKIIHFDISLAWRVSARTGDPFMQAGHYEDLHLAGFESSYCLDMEDFAMAGVPLVHRSRNYFRIGNERRKIKIAGYGSGGNIFWDSYAIHPASAPHLLNFLRRQKIFSPSEWSVEFIDQVWRRRQTLNRQFIAQWCASQVRWQLYNNPDYSAEFSNWRQQL